MEVRDVSMDFLYGEPFTESSPEAYERLLLDVLLGDATLFPRNDEVEAVLGGDRPARGVLGRARRRSRTGPASGARGRPTRCSPPRPTVAASVTLRSAPDGDLVTTLWDTNGSAVVKALAAERRTGGAVLSGLALTLVVVADESRVSEAEEAATHAAAAHPCRRARRRPAPARGPGAAARRRGAGRRPARPQRGRRHADVRPARPARRVGRAAAAGRRRPGRHLVARRAAGPAGLRRARRSSPTGGSPTARSPRTRWPRCSTRAKDYAPGDTDLAWTRTTPWRSTLASTLDSVSGRRGEPVHVNGGRIEGDPKNASAQLLAGWLSSRCGCTIAVESRRPGARAPAASTPSRWSWTRTRRSGSRPTAATAR